MNLLSTLGLHPAKIQQRNFISKIQKKPPKHMGNPSTQWRFAKYPGPPSCKNATTQFHKQNPVKPQKPYEIHVPNSDWIVGNCSRRSLLSSLGLPPAKMHQRNFISQRPNKPTPTYDIHVPSSDWMFGYCSREICLAPCAFLLQKFDNAIA